MAPSSGQWIDVDWVTSLLSDAYPADFPKWCACYQFASLWHVPRLSTLESTRHWLNSAETVGVSEVAISAGLSDANYMSSGCCYDSSPCSAYNGGEWNSGVYSGWTAVDLGREYLITKVEFTPCILTWYGSYSETRTEIIKIGSNIDNFRTVYEKSVFSTSGKRNSIDLSSEQTKSRYVLIEISSSASWVCLSKISIFAQEASIIELVSNRHTNTAPRWAWVKAPELNAYQIEIQEETGKSALTQTLGMLAAFLGRRALSPVSLIEHAFEAVLTVAVPGNLGRV